MRRLMHASIVDRSPMTSSDAETDSKSIISIIIMVQACASARDNAQRADERDESLCLHQRNGGTGWVVNETLVQIVSNYAVFMR